MIYAVAQNVDLGIPTEGYITGSLMPGGNVMPTAHILFRPLAG